VPEGFKFEAALSKVPGKSPLPSFPRCWRHHWIPLTRMPSAGTDSPFSSFFPPLTRFTSTNKVNFSLLRDTGVIQLFRTRSRSDLDLVPSLPFSSVASPPEKCVSPFPLISRTDPLMRSPLPFSLHPPLRVVSCSPHSLSRPIVFLAVLDLYA